eukprot:jgi/Galph1/5430/GphlegSOOS_G4104.1
MNILFELVAWIGLSSDIELENEGAKGSRNRAARGLSVVLVLVLVDYFDKTEIFCFMFSICLEQHWKRRFENIRTVP